MTEKKQYRCVNCGKAHNALYKTYGPCVLKLTKCDKCKGIVDKYIEYDPVIIMIDIVLMSKEAQRHVLYNTDFQSYWKLFIILVMLETYGVWRRDSLFNIAVDSFCDMQNGSGNVTVLSTAIPDILLNKCWAWQQQSKSTNNDLFIMEKDFYVQVISTFSGIVMFIMTLHILMRRMKSYTSRNEVSLIRVLKAFSLANMSQLFTLPMLVWGTVETSAETRTVHYLLVFSYSFVVFYNVFTVLYERPSVPTVLALAAAACSNYFTRLLVTPALRTHVL